MKRGEVWWADLGDPRGSEPGLRRPVVVVQEDLLNASALRTVMVVPLTSNRNRARAIGNILLSPRETGLDRDSVALVCQVMTLDEDFFDERVGTLSSRVRARLDRGLEIALGLG
ncbi:MAG: type II toxin-antitoxin system PemK/MazF family toxin [Deltaproteobacteria bacterium]|nr:type II toxin-antitoxin system PemK/MazF family toxin [Deltaproteobacteria bacterium]